MTTESKNVYALAACGIKDMQPNFSLLRSSVFHSSFAAQRATSPSQHSFQGLANPLQFPTELLFSTIYVLSLPIIPGLPVVIHLLFHNA